ncbi:hypothetical protein AVL50_19870 [Flammeovirga sp. SJP92]|nr:hypothetical protein AVL50_19870 [Flammeovirga sp. SJP92]
MPLYASEPGKWCIISYDSRTTEEDRHERTNYLGLNQIVMTNTLDQNELKHYFFSAFHSIGDSKISQHLKLEDIEIEFFNSKKEAKKRYQEKWNNIEKMATNPYPFKAVETHHTAFELQKNEEALPEIFYTVYTITLMSSPSYLLYDHDKGQFITWLDTPFGQTTVVAKNVQWSDDFNLIQGKKSESYFNCEIKEHTKNNQVKMLIADGELTPMTKEVLHQKGLCQTILEKYAFKPTSIDKVRRQKAVAN